MPWPFDPVIVEGTDLDTAFFQAWVDQINEAHGDDEALAVLIGDLAVEVATNAGFIAALGVALARAWTVCTSVTRPGSPVEGDQIYEIDTNRIWLYSGAAWVLTGGAVPRCRVTPAVATGTTSTVYAAVRYDTETFDTDEFHVSGANDSRITIPAGLGGIYRVSYSLSFTASTNGYRQSSINVNGSTTALFGAFLLPTTGSASLTPILTGSADLVLAAGDFVQVMANQNSGGALNVGVQPTVDFFQATYIGPA